MKKTRGGGWQEEKKGEDGGRETKRHNETRDEAKKETAHTRERGMLTGKQGKDGGMGQERKEV